MRATEIGIVVNENVALMEYFPLRNHRLDRIRHRAQVNWQVRALRHHLALAVEDTAGIVSGDLENWRVGGLCQYHLHFLRCGIEAIFNDLKGRRIGFHTQCSRHARITRHRTSP